MSDNRLLSMLAGAKNVMNKVETGDFKRGASGTLNESGLTGDKLLAQVPQGGQGGGYNEYAPRPVDVNNMGGTPYKNLNTTKMPANIVQAMVDNPSQAPSMAGPTFTLEDVSSLVNPNANQAPFTPPQHYPNQQPVQIDESIQQKYGQKTITLTEAELDAKIQNALFEFMSTTFTKNLKEQTIERTINALIKEGAIVKRGTTKKKKQV